MTAALSVADPDLPVGLLSGLSGILVQTVFDRHLPHSPISFVAPVGAGQMTHLSSLHESSDLE